MRVQLLFSGFLSLGEMAPWHKARLGSSQGTLQSRPPTSLPQKVCQHYGREGSGSCVGKDRNCAFALRKSCSRNSVVAILKLERMLSPQCRPHCGRQIALASRNCGRASGSSLRFRNGCSQESFVGSVEFSRLLCGLSLLLVHAGIRLRF